MMYLQMKQKILTSWTEQLTDGAGIVVHLLLLKGSMQLAIQQNNISPGRPPAGL